LVNEKNEIKIPLYNGSSVMIVIFFSIQQNIIIVLQVAPVASSGARAANAFWKRYGATAPMTAETNQTRHSAPKKTTRLKPTDY